MQSAASFGQASAVSHFGKGAVSIVGEQMHIAGWVPDGSHQIGEPIVVKIFGDHAARQITDLQPEWIRDVGESFDVVFGFENFRRNQKLPRDLVRILAQGGVCEIQQPLGGKILWVIAQNLLKTSNCFTRAALLFVECSRTKWENARIRPVQRKAIFNLADSQIIERLHRS
jgi:hypothetical protein